MTSFFERYGLAPVVNAAGTMTSLGASRIVPDAVAAASAISGTFVSIDRLQARASAVIARLTGAEAGFVTACSASGMSLAVAGAMTGPDLARIERLPETSGLKDEVVVQAGHLINYGAPIEQAVRITGARVVAAGSAALVQGYNVAAAITDRTAAALFVVSHHVVQEGQTPLDEFIAICRGRGVPVVVDMASEYDLRGPIALGAAAAVYSSHKFLGGPTAGIMAGDKALIRAAYLQNHGLGRPMKVGKEGILGAMAALEAWERRDPAAARAAQEAHVRLWLESLSGLPGLTVSRTADWTGNPIDRVRVGVDPARAGLFAWELADRLASGTPSVQVRDDLVEHGHFYLDPCNLGPGEDRIVAQRIVEEIRGAAERRDGCRVGWGERRRRGIDALLRWPD